MIAHDRTRLIGWLSFLQLQTFVARVNVTDTYSHHSVMLQEALIGLNILPHGIYIDGTFGRGGHASAILQRLNADGRLICFDKDPEAILFAQTHFGQDPRVVIIHDCFSQLSSVIERLGFKNRVNGILLDLGVSSPQLDNAARGFSFMREGPLDMRMDPTQGLSACEWINTAPMEEMIWVFYQYGEEKLAKRIASKICAARIVAPIKTTTELANIVAASYPAKKWCKAPAAKTFQAIRIHLNQELQAMDQVLQLAESVLAPLGRFVIISFHSLEDRKVKQHFRAHSRVTLPKGVAIPEKELHTQLKWIVKKQRASDEEVENNPRARSATLRVAEKTACIAE